MLVALTTYTLDVYPTAPEEVCGGRQSFRRPFSVSYFQSLWAGELGGDGSFGMQAAIVVLGVVPVLLVHIYGHRVRLKFGETGGHLPVKPVGYLTEGRIGL